MTVDEHVREAMSAALDEAAGALATGDVPVGAVVIDRAGRVIGRGRNRKEAEHDPTAHAELIALRQAAAATGDWRLEDATLVVTLEPCVMCAGAIVAARIDRLVFGAWDDKAGAAGSAFDLVRDRRLNHRVEVVGGVEEDACSRLLTRFFRGEEPERPASAPGGMPAAADPSPDQETAGSDFPGREPGARPSR